MYVRKKTNDKKSCDESNEANILINGNLYRVNIAREWLINIITGIIYQAIGKIDISRLVTNAVQSNAQDNQMNFVLVNVG